MAFLTSLANVSDLGGLVWGNVNVRFMTALSSGSDYTTGGYLITPALVGLRTIITVEVVAQAGTSLTTMYPSLWNTTTPGLQFFYSGGTTPSGTINIATVTNAGTSKPVYTNTITSVETLTQTTGNASIAGATFTGAAGSAAGLTEVSNGSGFSGVTFTLRILGND